MWDKLYIFGEVTPYEVNGGVIVRSKGQSHCERNVKIVFTHIFVKHGSISLNQDQSDCTFYTSSTSSTFHQQKMQIFVCLSYLSFSSYWNIFIGILLPTLVNGEVIISDKKSRSLGTKMQGSFLLTSS